MIPAKKQDGRSNVEIRLKLEVDGWRLCDKSLLIWRSCVTAWRCWSWERSCWSHWLWRTWSPWSHSFWTERDTTGSLLASVRNLFLQQEVQTSSMSLFVFYLKGIAGFFLPKLDSKMKPSNAMTTNWVKVIMLPHPGNSLKNKTTGETEICPEKIQTYQQMESS